MSAEPLLTLNLKGSAREGGGARKYNLLHPAMAGGRKDGRCKARGGGLALKLKGSAREGGGARKYNLLHPAMAVGRKDCRCKVTAGRAGRETGSANRSEEHT